MAAEIYITCVLAVDLRKSQFSWCWENICFAGKGDYELIGGGISALIMY